jgi:hypothetical protein
MKLSKAILSLRIQRLFGSVPNLSFWLERYLSVSLLVMIKYWSYGEMRRKIRGNDPESKSK